MILPALALLFIPAKVALLPPMLATAQQASQAKQAPKIHPEVQKLIDRATGSGLQHKDRLSILEEARVLARQLKDEPGEARCLLLSAVVHSLLGEQRKALEFFEQALPLLRKLEDTGGEATTLNNIGLVE